MKTMVNIISTLLFIFFMPACFASSVDVVFIPKIYLSHSSLVPLELTIDERTVEFDHYSEPLSAYHIFSSVTRTGFWMFFKEVNGEKFYITGLDVYSDLKTFRGVDPATITDLGTLLNDPRTFVQVNFSENGSYYLNTSSNGYLALDCSDPNNYPYPAILVDNLEDASVMFTTFQ
ncbi:hypothetical protein [Microbulbifer spongiae]|uniref:Uncharacterized protein n=1 Tax=Microbulbifer spongiae TaxID=2944933 RepID=A0ABY9EDD1_9GAMM|nr:hypothetical protein [Microbulbifer sp. MI-G]WKD51023.1 hypothetical protein M8T91_06275 [Microbulbifer sp. MI-G]